MSIYNPRYTHRQILKNKSIRKMSDAKLEDVLKYEVSYETFRKIQPDGVMDFAREKVVGLRKLWKKEVKP